LRFLIAMFFSLWFAGFAVAVVENRYSSTKVLIPIWLSKILFFKKMDAVPIESLILQPCVYVLVVAVVFAYYLNVLTSGIYVLFYRLWEILLILFGSYTIFTAIWNYSKRKDV